MRFVTVTELETMRKNKAVTEKLIARLAQAQHDYYLNLAQKFTTFFEDKKTDNLD